MKRYLKQNLIVLRKGLLQAGYGYEETADKLVKFQKNIHIKSQLKTNLKATDVLLSCFVWSHSIEKTAFWETIYERLLKAEKEVE